MTVSVYSGEGHSQASSQSHQTTTNTLTGLLRPVDPSQSSWVKAGVMSNILTAPGSCSFTSWCHQVRAELEAHGHTGQGRAGAPEQSLHRTPTPQVGTVREAHHGH